ncbi:MAG TPA: SH3 domain-containing protein, partial [Thermomicrobiales bacterium]|nr:SH3 domain-containing protein [Thermomicrobiales bacterium]
MTTLRPTTSLWRRTRSTILAGSIALGSILAPAGLAVADTGPGTSGQSDQFEWDGGSLESATAIVAAGGDGLDMRGEPSRDGTVVSTIPNGTVIDLRIDETDTVLEGDLRWWPVTYGGESGWVPGTDLIDATGLAAGSVPFD